MCVRVWMENFEGFGIDDGFLVVWDEVSFNCVSNNQFKHFALLVPSFTFSN